VIGASVSSVVVVFNSNGANENVLSSKDIQIVNYICGSSGYNDSSYYG